MERETPYLHVWYMNKESNNAKVGIPFLRSHRTDVTEVYHVPHNRTHATVFNAAATAFFNMRAAQLTFPRRIFPNVVESIITISS